MSSKIFVPLSRLVFLMAFYNFIFIHYSTASTRSVSSYDILFYLKEASFNIIMTLVISYFAYLFFDGPIESILSKTFFKSKARSQINDGIEKEEFKPKVN